MKTKRFSLALALAAAILFGALTCAAQNNNQKFGLATELAGYLQLNASQIDGISKNLLVLNYDWNEAVNNTLLLDQQLTAVQNDATQSPSSIGLSAGSYIQQKVTVARAIIAEVVASNKALLGMLTPAQQQKLAAVQSAISAQNASNIYSLGGGATFGNFFLGQYSVTGFDPNNANMPYPSPPQTMNAALGEAFNTAVEEAKIQATKDKATAARQARMIPLGEKR